MNSGGTGCKWSQLIQAGKENREKVKSQWRVAGREMGLLVEHFGGKAKVTRRSGGELTDSPKRAVLVPERNP